VSESVVGVVLEADACGGIPLGMLLCEALPGKGFHLQLLTLSQLHDQNVCQAQGKTMDE